MSDRRTPSRTERPGLPFLFRKTAQDRRQMQVGWGGVQHFDVGLENLNGTGAFNAALQVLLHCPGFTHWALLDEEEHLHRRACQNFQCITCTIRALFKAMSNYEEAVSPTLLFDVWKASHTAELLEEHKDIHLFLLALLERLDLEYQGTLKEEVVRDQWNVFLSPSFNNFGGIWRLDGECSKCKLGTTVYEAFSSLDVPLDGKVTIQECLSAILPSKQTTDSSLVCSRCGESEFVWKACSVHSYPKYLMLKLQRFDNDGKKLLRDIYLDVSVTFGTLQTKYNFCAAVLHEGEGLRYGHFKALVRCPGLTYHVINDCQVTKVSPLRLSSAFSLTTYVIVYEIFSECQEVLFMDCFSPRKDTDRTSSDIREQNSITGTQKTWTVNNTPSISERYERGTPSIFRVMDSPLSFGSLREESKSSNEEKVSKQKKITTSGHGSQKRGQLKPRSLNMDACMDANTCDVLAATKDTYSAENLNAKNSTVLLAENVKVVHRGVQVNTPPVSLCVCRHTLSPEKFRFFTGLTQEHFDVFYRLLGGDEVIGKLKYYYDGVTPTKVTSKIKFPLPDRLFLTLIRMRRGVPIVDLAHIFHLSSVHVSRIVYAMIRHMATTLHSLHEALFVTAEDQKKMKSLASRMFPNLRVILDGAHFLIQRPDNFQQQGNTFSEYKASNTVVFVIGVSCSGAVIFVSPGFEGNMSEREVVLNSGLLQHLQQGDVVMTDRGFDLTSDLEKIGVRLIKPPQLGGRKKFTPEEEILSKNVASVRISVEHAIGAIKDFRILRGEIPITLLPILPDMVLIAAYLTNFRAPLGEKADSK